MQRNFFKTQQNHQTTFAYPLHFLAILSHFSETVPIILHVSSIHIHNSAHISKLIPIIPPFSRKKSAIVIIDLFNVKKMYIYRSPGLSSKGADKKTDIVTPYLITGTGSFETCFYIPFSKLLLFIIQTVYTCFTLVYESFISLILMSTFLLFCRHFKSLG